MSDLEPGRLRRFETICKTIDRQRAYIARVPDPDNREQAESHLIMLVRMRGELERQLGITPQPQNN